MDTIYALATPLGAGVAIMRISGLHAKKALINLFSHQGEYEPRKLYYGNIIEDNNLIDDAMAVYMPAPKSYTGEDCVEFHIHGSSAVAKSLMSALMQLGFRLAQPGEFSRRAFENGKMDLAQAEAVMSLIQAEAKKSADLALSQLKGHLSKQIEQIQDDLTNIIAQLEAFLDYPEEDWVHETVIEIQALIQIASDKVNLLLSHAEEGRIVRDGLRVVLIGRPNVGKSTLFNALLGHERAIVTEFAGTTRDVIDERLQIAGYPIHLMDTAGLREDGADDVEKIGIGLSKAEMKKADFILFLLDTSQELHDEDKELLKQTAHQKRAILLNKTDLEPLWKKENLELHKDDIVLSISAKEQEGLEGLIDCISSTFSTIDYGIDQGLLSNQRHIEACMRANSALDDASQAIILGDMDCVSIDVRSAWSSLGEITGNTVDEQIIDRIFERFCLGK